MDKRVLRERMRKKQQQIRRRQMMKKGAYVVAVILVLIFVIRGIILPVINRAGGGNTEKPQQVQAETDSTTADSSSDSTDTGDTSTETNAAIRQPVKGQSDLTKAAQLTTGWHDDENGKWYQNADGTYFAGGMQEIDGSTYYFDDNGYIKTGWVEVGFDDYYFNDDGTYDPSQHKTRIAFTFDDGPGEYTDELLDCLEENNAHATFFMLGQNVGSWESTVQRMADIGCEIGSHSWDHPNLYDLSMDSVAKEFSDTDAALEKACGQKASVARAPYGNWSDDIISTVGKPFFTWSLDSMDWSYLDVNKDYDAVMNGDLTDGSIILMHDIHEPSVQAAIKMIPELVQKGYKLMTVSWQQRRELPYRVPIILISGTAPCRRESLQDTAEIPQIHPVMKAQMVRILLMTEVQIHRMEVLTMALPMMNLQMMVPTMMEVPMTDIQMTAPTMTEVMMKAIIRRSNTK